MRTAVVINPTGVTDVEQKHQEIVAALSDVDSPAPMWLATTADDPGGGQTRAAIAAGVDVVFAYGGTARSGRAPTSSPALRSRSASCRPARATWSRRT